MGEELNITRTNGRALQRRKERKDAFGKAKQKLFLGHFAGTCNIKKSCELAGVDRSTVYMRRNSDPQFKAAWAAAQEQGYATLRAELVRRSLEFLQAIVPDENAEATLAGMDAKLILSVLQHNDKTIGREPGDVYPQRSDVAGATERLAKLLKRMKLEMEDAAPPACLALPAPDAGE